jgi:hypothetical protein
MGFFEQGMLAPSREFSIEIVLNCFFRASSAFKLFEAGLRSLELPLSGQQCLQVIRGWASVPQIASFGLAVPSSYSRSGFDPSNCLFRPSYAFKVSELELRTFESSLSSLQRHHAIRVQMSEPSKRIPRLLAPSFCSSMG